METVRRRKNERRSVCSRACVIVPVLTKMHDYKNTAGRGCTQYSPCIPTNLGNFSGFHVWYLTCQFVTCRGPLVPQSGPINTPVLTEKSSSVPFPFPAPSPAKPKSQPTARFIISPIPQDRARAWIADCTSWTGASDRLMRGDNLFLPKRMQGMFAIRVAFRVMRSRVHPRPCGETYCISILQPLEATPTISLHPPAPSQRVVS